MKLQLRYYPQHTDYSCGPVCLRMVFEHLGKKYSENKLIKLSKSTIQNGTSHENILKEVKKEGFNCEEKHKGTIKDLISSLENGHFPIIHYIDPFSGIGHYSVVTGYDKKAKKMILADPCNGDDYTIDWKNLKAKWHNTTKTSVGWFLIIEKF